MSPIPSLSKRAIATPASPIRKLVPLADQAVRQGVNIYHLNIGQPDIQSPPAFLNALRAYPHDPIAYENSLGNHQLRQAMSGYYRRHKIALKEAEIQITVGGSEAILFALMATCDPGEECLVFEPFYANYQGFAHMAGVQLKAVRTLPQTGFHLPDTGVWEKAVTAKTRAILVANPNNPTGTVYGLRELKTLDRFARTHELTLIADETYREFVFDGSLHYSFLSLGDRPQHVILVDSLSKRYSLCGARIGCLATYNEKVLAATTKFCQARLAAPTVEQAAAIEVVQSDAKSIEEVRVEYEKRRDTIIAGLAKIPGVFVKKPEGAFYAVVGLPVPDAETFSSWLLTDFRLDNETVMLAPAQGFYLTRGLGRNEVRIAFVLESKALTRALVILKKALQTYLRY